MNPTHRRSSVVALAGALAFALAGCGGSSGTPEGSGGDVAMSATPTAQVTAPPPAGAKVIAVTVGKDSVSPSGDQVAVKVNQPIVFQIDAAEAGELHVHSSPAKAIDFPAGASQVQISIDKPGLVEAEIENLGKPVVQLEVK